MRILLFVLILLGSTTIFAQTEKELKKDKDVPWAGTVMVDYCPNIHHFSKKGEELKKKYGIEAGNFELLKYQVDDLRNVSDYQYTLANKMLDGAIIYYKDSDLREAMTKQEFERKTTSIDTVIAYDPETYIEKIKVVRNDMNPEDIKYMRVKYLVYFSKKENNFIAKPLAIAPLLDMADYNAVKRDLQPIGWVKVEALTITPDLNDSNINWAKRFSKKISRHDIDLFKEKMTFEEVFTTMIDSYKENPTDFSLYSSYNGSLIGLDEMKRLGESVDTVVTFDPETFEEQVRVVKRDMEPESIASLSFVQNWIWDKKRKQLVIHNQGIAPIVKVFDDAGSFLYRVPMFYREEKLD